jgi:hypothetical protein
MFDFIVNWFTFIAEWISTGIYTFFTSAFAALVEWLTLVMIKWTIYATGFAWDVAKVIIQDLQLSQRLDSAWAAVPGDISSALNFFRVPEAVNMLLSSVATRWVLRFIPFA